MLVRLMYASRALPAVDQEELLAILKKSKVNNPKAGITGVLCFSEGIFIQVLEGGRIVERGSHGELLARDGRYKQLYDKQYKLETNRFINPGEDFTPEPETPASPARAAQSL